MPYSRTRTGAGLLLDEVRRSPVDEELERKRRRKLFVLLLLVGALSATCWFTRHARAAQARSVPAPLQSEVHAR